jgi:hypothetical protein
MCARCERPKDFCKQVWRVNEIDSSLVEPNAPVFHFPVEISRRRSLAASNELSEIHRYLLNIGFAIFPLSYFDLWHLHVQYRADNSHQAFN